MPVLDPELLAAFRATRYEAAVAGLRFAARIGEPPPAGLLALTGGPVAFLTAANPGGRRLPEPANRRRMAELEATLTHLGLAHWPAWHRAEDPAWDEPAFLVRCEDLEALDRLARRFAQLATVRLAPGMPVRLRCYAGTPAAAAGEDLELAPPAAVEAAASDGLRLLATEQLTFRRNGERILGPLSLTVHAGELWLVEGANGSGKTTLLRLLAGLLEPGAEEDAPARIERAVPPAFLGHQLGLRAELSALANLRFARALAGAPGLAPSAALAAVGLSGWEERPVAELSAGQRKRVALARLLVAPAPLWLLDEPYANLDGAGAELLNRLLDQQLARDGAAVITAHGPVPWRGPCRRLAL